jgi:hypothetical protein
MLRGLVAGALMVFATDLPAQTAPDSDPVVQAGSRVRITSMDSLRVTGRVAAINDERLFVQPRHGVPVAIPITSIETVQISRGHRSHTLKGALIGGLITGSAAALLFSRDGTAEYGGRTGAAGYGFTLGAVPGLLVGTVVGYLTSPERWVSGAVPGRR